MENAVEIYRKGEGRVVFRVDMDGETIWARQEQLAELFDVDRTVITRHLRNIFRSGELEESAVCAKNAHTASDGKTYMTNFYNLDAIISVGYRVNSRKATDFRKWATRVLREYVVDGVAVNEVRLKQLDVEKLRGVEGAIGVVKRLIASKELDASEAGGVLEVLTKYSTTWDVLEKYDKGKIFFGKGRRAKWKLTTEYAKGLIDEMRKELSASELFGKVRGGGFEGVVGAIYQTFEGKDLYGTIAEKATNLLYLVIKDHPFYDGNKRIGAFLFVMFLTMNDFALDEGGECRISDRALTAIALLIAESRPEEKELIVALVGRLLEGK